MNWEPISTNPKDGRIYMVFCPDNGFKKHRTMVAFYALPFTVETEGDDGEYQESDGACYLAEGWYEWGWLNEVAHPIDWPITHWMPLPQPPEEKP